MTTLEENQTWDLINPLASKAAIGCKWVYVVKINLGGSLSRLKARTVSKGYAQMYDMEYT